MADAPKGIGDFDPTGLKVLTVTATDFLKAICLPAAQEFGQLMADPIRVWRAQNLENEIQRARAILGDEPNVHAHPRVVHETIEHGSWVDDHEVQDWWGGLIASSCTDDGKDDSNLLFTNLLGQLSTFQARVVKYGCEHCRKSVSTYGNAKLIEARPHVQLHIAELQKTMGTLHIDRIDRELDHLVSLGLLPMKIEGINLYRDTADITPANLALHLYVRCNGSRANPVDFFKVDDE